MEYELDEDVTQMARSKEPSESAVFSVRLNHDEVTFLEWYAREHGLTVSDVLREGIRRLPEVHVTITPQFTAQVG